jgi:hypothetical protein
MGDQSISLENRISEISALFFSALSAEKLNSRFFPQMITDFEGRRF